MDEAGTGNPKIEPFVVVAGVIVHADNKLVTVKKHLRSIVNEFIPEDCREGFVCHAKEIFNGGGVVFDRKKPRLTEARKYEFADALAEIPKKFDLPIVLGWERRSDICHKYGFPEGLSQRDQTIAAHAVSFLLAAMNVEVWMRKNGRLENCLMVVEDCDMSRSMLRDVQRVHQNKNALMDERAKGMLPLTKIQEDPLFQPKKSANPLEIADFCAFIWKRFVMNQQDPFWRRFLGAFRQQIVAERAIGC